MKLDLFINENKTKKISKVKRKNSFVQKNKKQKKFGKAEKLLVMPLQ